MLALQARHGFSHSIEVEAFFDMPGILPKEGRRNRSIPDAIVVDLAPGIVSGMERTSNYLAVFDHDISRQKAIQAIDEDLRGQFCVNEEVGDLVQGMHSGICAPGSDDCHQTAGHGFQGSLNGSLNRGDVLLALPAMISRAVVFDNELEVLQ